MPRGQVTSVKNGSLSAELGPASGGGVLLPLASGVPPPVAPPRVTSSVGPTVDGRGTPPFALYSAASRRGEIR
jgi:hypothetical protein